jgi:hypothetical protein
MATVVKNAQQRAATVALKEERAREAARAMRDYEVERLAIRANTARLRALRLAKEARTDQPMKKKKSTKKDASSEGLSS